MKASENDLMKKLINLSLLQTNALALLSDQVAQVAKKGKVNLTTSQQLTETFQKNQAFQKELLAEWNQLHPDQAYKFHFGSQQ